MVKGYELKCDYGCIGGMYEHESYENIGADYVLASDYAALEAERDALQREKDALTEVYASVSAELARVKAESLRVVPEGKGLEYKTIPPGVLFHAEDMIATKNGDIPPFSSMEDAWVFDKSYPITTFKGDQIVQPVRLERWEDEG